MGEAFAEAEAVVAVAVAAIKAGVAPELIVAGSSGSYFIQDKERKKIAVFKPKNEEPFAELNPKWTKFWQRVLSPCCFGRRCLLYNQGYLSEAGASLVDSAFPFNVVPPTVVASLASPAFNYPRNKAGTTDLPLKVGSFQLFVHDAHDAALILQRLGYMNSDTADLKFANEQVRESFHAQVQRMIAFDYLIRNTDRSGANWMIKYKTEAGKVQQIPGQTGGKVGETELKSKSKSSSSDNAGLETAIPYEPDSVTEMTIAAIDNGLAFPFKHPQDFRSYPFYWATLKPFCDEPFRESLRNHLVPRLRDPFFIRRVCDQLTALFKKDKSFRRDLCQRQMSVMRGQMWNLAEALECRMSPAQLAAQTPLLVVPKTLHQIRLSVSSPFHTHQTKAWRSSQFPAICSGLDVGTAGMRKELDTI